ATFANQSYWLLPTPRPLAASHARTRSFASWALGSAMHWDANHLDACKMMMVARGGCQVAADVPSAVLETWADLKANKYAEACDTGLDGEKGYRITNAGRAAYKVEIRRPS